MKTKARSLAVTGGVIRRAAKLGRGVYHKSTYSRTLSGIFVTANPEVVYHLRRAIAETEAALRAGERQSKKARSKRAR